MPLLMKLAITAILIANGILWFRGLNKGNTIDQVLRAMAAGCGVIVVAWAYSSL
jgi:hypothetical protein